MNCMHEAVLHVQACVIGALSTDEDIEQGGPAALCTAELLAPWVTTAPVSTLHAVRATHQDSHMMHHGIAVTACTHHCCRRGSGS